MMGKSAARVNSRKALAGSGLPGDGPQRPCRILAACSCCQPLSTIEKQG
jgi:hypothetical protein